MTKEIASNLQGLDEKTIFTHLIKMIESYRFAERSGKLVDYHNPTELRRILDLDRPGKTCDWQEIFHWIDKYLTYCVKTNHPAFVNRMWVGGNLPSIVGEIVAAVSNTSACTYESAPVSTLLEEYMIRQMLNLVGFVKGEGQMTTGSSNANMIAMMLARNLANTAAKRTGLFDQQKLFAFVSSDAHYSMDRAANILGIGVDQLVKVSSDRSGAMVVADLKLAINRVLASGGAPFFVAATAGTTVRGAYDPIEPLLELRDRYGFWLHADGAWGGSIMLSKSLRQQFLRGVEKVDSFTCDFHKMLGTSLMCNVLLINKETKILGSSLGVGDGSYLFRDEMDNGIEDLGLSSLQCGRRVDSLKWFLDWKFFGRQGLAKRVERYYELCQYAENWVNDSSALEMVVPRISFNICFRFKVAKEKSTDFNFTLRTRLHQNGTSIVGIAYIAGDLVLRLLITNPTAEESDIDSFFNNLVKTGQIMLGEQNKR